MLRYANAFLLQTTTTALANGRSKIDERLARWLLMAADRVNAKELPLTHEFLAYAWDLSPRGHAVQALKGSLISARRGGITISIARLWRRDPTAPTSGSGLVGASAWGSLLQRPPSRPSGTRVTEFAERSGPKRPKLDQRNLQSGTRRGTVAIAGPSILVVEDEPLIAVDIADCLQQAGACCLQRTHLRDGLRLAGHPDVAPPLWISV